MFGRTKIYTDATAITPNNIVQVLRDAFIVHSKNSFEIERLYNYFKGKQDILQRVKTVRPEICNKVVENRANEIVSFKTGYLCGEPLQFISRGRSKDVSVAVSQLNDLMLLCGKPARDKEIAEWMYIAGQGYRIVTSNKRYIRNGIIPRLMNKRIQLVEDDSPFNVYTLDPRYTFCVYSSTLGEPCLMGVKYIVKQDGQKVFSVYTDSRYYEIKAERVTRDEPNPLKHIPIVEYPLNNARLGAFEIVMPLLDAINKVQSNRLDGVEQFIASLWVIYNAEVDDDQAKQLRDAGLITLKSFGENKADIKSIAEQLDQQQTQTLIDYMYQTILNITGMPNRNGGLSTSDTGSAVQMRDGWQAAEARAKDDELMFKESEREFLRLVLHITRNTIGTPLKLSDVEVKFTRRNYENLQSKVQVFDMMLKNPKVAPIDAYTVPGIFPDPEDACARGLNYYKEITTALEAELNAIV